MRMLTNTQGQKVPDLGFGVSRNLTPQQLSRHYEETYNNKVYYARWQTYEGWSREEWWDYNEELGIERYLKKSDENVDYEHIEYFDNTGALIKKTTNSDGESSTYYYVIIHHIHLKV